MPVMVANRGERFEPAHAYIGEPGDHLTLAARSFGELVSDPEAQYRNRTVDLLFHSVAMHGGTRIIGVILSGSLDDGSRGAASIHHAGGLTWCSRRPPSDEACRKMRLLMMVQWI
jgi:two-component system chemotaxis response regulator CheB